MTNPAVISQMNGAPRELNQAASSTTETVFTTDGTIPVVLPLPTAAQLGGPNRSSMFRVRAWGMVSTAASLTFDVRLYYGTSTTVADNTLLVDSGTITIATTTTNWSIWADLVWDGNSDVINGRGGANVHLTSSGGTGYLMNQVTSADPDGDATRGFVVSGQFGTGNVGNTARLSGMQIVL